MKLWKISQTENSDYDTYDSAVVAAETAQDAVQINPAGKQDWGTTYRSWARSPEGVKAELLGEAAKGIKAGVILASFNAG